MIEKIHFGYTSKGEEVNEFILDNGEIRVHVLDFGAIINKIFVKDKNGVTRDVVLGYDNVEGYEQNGGYLGAFIGRVGNRIRNSRFTINGIEYKVESNEGETCLHGGKEGFDKKVHLATIEGEKLVLSAVSPDGEQGFPGELKYKITYSLDGCGIDINYEAVSNKDTYVNLTNHSYFNLSGENTALNHLISINSDNITAVDKQLVPTGEFLAVENTPFDLRKPQKVGLYIDYPHKQIEYGGGYDHNFVLKNYGKYEQIATLHAPDTGIKMCVYSDSFGVQFYSGNFLANEIGKGGRVHQKRSAVCLETQNFPNAINIPSFPNAILKAGDLYHTRTTYKFSVEE